MNFVGVALHKKTAVVCVVNQARQLLETCRLACSDADGIRNWFATLESFQVVVEATASNAWFAQLIEPLADRVVLAHPNKLRVIAESTRKSDKLDAKVLAEFLALDMIPEADRPTPRQREHRQWVRHRPRHDRCPAQSQQGRFRLRWRLGRLPRDLLTSCHATSNASATGRGMLAAPSAKSSNRVQSLRFDTPPT